MTGYTNNSAAVCQGLSLFEMKKKDFYDKFSFIDIDECLLSSNKENICPDPTTSCVNNLGSYSCVCKPGYTKANTSVNIKILFYNIELYFLLPRQPVLVLILMNA